MRESTRELPVTAASRRLPWSLLQAEFIHVPLGPEAGPASPTWAVFAERFERCLGGVSSYVSRRVSDPERLERIVTEVVVGNLHLLVGQPDSRKRLIGLKAAADRLIEERPRPSAREMDRAVPAGAPDGAPRDEPLP